MIQHWLSHKCSIQHSQLNDTNNRTSKPANQYVPVHVFIAKVNNTELWDNNVGISLHSYCLGAMKMSEVFPVFNLQANVSISDQGLYMIASVHPKHEQTFASTDSLVCNSLFQWWYQCDRECCLLMLELVELFYPRNDSHTREQWTSEYCMRIHP